MTHLFVKGNFKSHAGLDLDWKIECDSLTNDDIATLAYLIGTRLKFGAVIGIPRGGSKLALALQSFRTKGPVLIVDDVLTTGTSMNKMKAKYPDAVGVVIFARGVCPDWIMPVFQSHIF